MTKTGKELIKSILNLDELTDEQKLEILAKLVSDERG